MKTRVISIAVLPENQPLFSEMATRVSINDEGGGEFVEVEQNATTQTIQIHASEWPGIRAAIDSMIAGCDGGDA